MFAKTVSDISAMLKLGQDFIPGPFDVICARGKDAKLHKGNIQFRQKIEQSKNAYATAGSRLYKSLVVSSVVEWVRQASPEGGFVKKVDGVWYEVGDHLAREKVGQSLREQLHSQYKSSAKSKRRRKKMQVQQLSPQMLEDLVCSNNNICKNIEAVEQQRCEIGGHNASDDLILNLFNANNALILSTITNDLSLQKGIMQLASEPAAPTTFIAV